MLPGNLFPNSWSHGPEVAPAFPVLGRLAVSLGTYNLPNSPRASVYIRTVREPVVPVVASGDAEGLKFSPSKGTRSSLQPAPGRRPLLD